MNKALREEEVVTVGRVDMRDAPPVSDDFHGLSETREVKTSIDLRQAPAAQPGEPGPKNRSKSTMDDGHLFSLPDIESKPALSVPALLPWPIQLCQEYCGSGFAFELLTQVYLSYPTGNALCVPTTAIIGPSWKPSATPEES
jgi:hypothetical protein